ncbi:MAG: FAD-binding protein, partial [Actinomycetia bacterium]|nr:FAD-binding protein [Actinomycetes bacterium]
MDLDLIIVGGGIAGSAAALRAAQNGMSALWIRGTRADHKRSRGHWVVNIDNMVGVHEGIVRGKVERLFARGPEHATARDLLAAQGPFTISTRDLIANVV